MGEAEGNQDCIPGQGNGAMLKKKTGPCSCATQGSQPLVGSQQTHREGSRDPQNWTSVGSATGSAPFQAYLSRASLGACLELWLVTAAISKLT